MKGAWLGSAVGALLALTPCPAAAIVPSEAEIAALATQINDITAKAGAGDLKGAIRLTDRLVTKLDKGDYPARARAAAYAMQAITYAGAGRQPEASRATDHVVALTNSRIMVHQPSGGAQG
ncbi:MAG: hypothetical protein EOP60_17215, partial [Sphingomonadales bacterium]